jgi:hypothetical protein
VVDPHDDGSVEARLLMAAPSDKGAVMCIVYVRAEERAQLPELKKFCMSVRVEQ